MASVTVNGVTYTDDANATTGLANGGHRTRLVPMFSNAVIDLDAKQAAAAASQGAAATSAGNATTQAAAAAASAASAAAIAGAFVGTSTSSLLIGTGSKTFATQTGEQYTAGVFLSAVSAANTANYMFGQVTSYNSGTGALVMDIQVIGGSGTYADWNISLVGARGAPGAGITPQAVGFTAAGGTTTKTLTVDVDLTASNVAVKAANTFTAAQEFATGTAIASAATINLDTATGNRVHITGTTTITAVTLTRGPRTVIFDGVLTLTHNATTNNLPGGVNITTAVGDRAIYESDGTAVYCVSYIKASGAAVISAANPLMGTAGTATVVDAIGASGSLSICAFSSGRSIVLYRPSTAVVNAALLTATGSVVTTATVEAVAPQANIKMQIVPLTSTTALALYALASSVRAVVLTDAGSSITVGTIVTVEALNGAPLALMKFSGTQLAAIYYDVVGLTTRAAVLNISGTTITVITPVVVPGVGDGKICAIGLSSTQGIYFTVSASNTTVSSYVVTISGNALTMSSAQNSGVATLAPATMDVSFVSSSRVAIAVAQQTSAAGYVCLLDVSGTGAAATVQVGKPTLIYSGGNNFTKTRLLQLSANTLLYQSSDPTNTSIYIMPITISGSSLLTSDGVSVTRSSGSHDFCVPAAGSVLSLYVDSANGSYPTTRVISLGTVV